MNLKTPDITKAQVLAALAWGLAQAVSMNWISAAESQHIFQIGSTVLAAALVVADWFIRGNRAKAHAIVAATKVQEAANGGEPGGNLEDKSEPAPAQAPALVPRDPTTTTG